MTARAVVVGGGVTGGFAAYFLAKRGWQVTCLDRRDPGAASVNNPGGLNPLHGPGIPGPLAAFAMESFAIHVTEEAAIAELSGIDHGFRRIGRLSATFDERDTDKDGAIIERYRAAGEGFDARWLDGDELRSLEPRLASAVRGGLLTTGNGRVDARRFVAALGAAGQALGAEQRQAEALGIEVNGARVTGVRTQHGVLGCETVIIATGAWSEAPAHWLGTSLPVEPVAGELLMVRLGGEDPFAFDLSWQDTASLYDVGMPNVLLGGTESRVGYDVMPTSGAQSSIVDRVARLVPSVRRAPVVERLVGLRPVTPDGLPILGRAPGWDNVIVAMGGGRKGMLLAAGMGRAVADWAVEGATALSVAPLTPERFCSATSAA